MAIKRMYPDNLLHQVKIENLMVEDLNFEYLTERERAVILMHYRDGISRKQLAEIFEVTDKRMRQIIDRAIRRLRKSSKHN